jgi:hypothetical protein
MLVSELENYIDITSKEDRAQLEIWVRRKGYFLYKQAAQILLEVKGSKPDYMEAASLIRYDKSIRDLLFVFLATYEEYVKKELCDNYDIKSDELFLKKKIEDNLLVQADPRRSKLFFEMSRKHIDLCDLLKLAKKAKLCIDYDKAESVRKLRNRTMHHSMLCLGGAETKDEALANLKETKREIEALWYLLPDQIYKDELEKGINNLFLAERPYFTRINLGRMNDGIFV